MQSCGHLYALLDIPRFADDPLPVFQIGAPQRLIHDPMDDFDHGSPPLWLQYIPRFSPAGNVPLVGFHRPQTAAKEFISERHICKTDHD
jgi:hypothetical protein